MAKDLQEALSLTDDDIRPAIMGEKGMDIKLMSVSARERVGLAIECKNTEKLNIWEALKQASIEQYPVCPDCKGVLKPAGTVRCLHPQSCKYLRGDRMGKVNRATDEPDLQHACIDCSELNKEYVEVRNGLKRCMECGGTVLDLQELLDKIKTLESDLEWERQ